MYLGDTSREDLSTIFQVFPRILKAHVVTYRQEPMVRMTWTISSRSIVREQRSVTVSLDY